MSTINPSSQLVKTDPFQGSAIPNFNDSSPILASKVEIQGVDIIHFQTIMQNGAVKPPSQLANLNQVSSVVIKQVDAEYRAALTTYLDQCSEALKKDQQLQVILNAIKPEQLISDINLLPNMGVVQHVVEAFWAFLRNFVDVGPSSTALVAVKTYITGQSSVHRLACMRVISDQEVLRLRRVKTLLTERSQTLVKQLEDLRKANVSNAQIKSEMREVDAVFSVMFPTQKLLVNGKSMQECLQN